MIRRLVVRIAAKVMRQGLTSEKLDGILYRSFRWRDQTWRNGVLNDAIARNDAPGLAP